MKKTIQILAQKKKYDGEECFAPHLLLISGAGAGILYGLSIAVIAETDQPDKNYGIALASQLIFGSILLFLGPSLIIPTWGLSGLFIGTAIFVGFIGACLPWMPAQLEQSAIEGESNILNTTNSRLHARFLAVVCPDDLSDLAFHALREMERNQLIDNLSIIRSGDFGKYLDKIIESQLPALSKI